jgi:AcrR family transcriptional regulator
MYNEIAMDPDVKFSEHTRTVKSRPYRMVRRAELVENTRQRIVEAAVELHTTVGPAATTISALAEKAGVTRLTVYRHFSDEDDLFAACRSHWRTLHPPPDPLRWPRLPPGEHRVRQALEELYRWYRQHGEELFPIYRDFSAMPKSLQEASRAADDRAARALVDGFAARGGARRRLVAAARHVVGFWTWWSLAVDQRLPDREAVELATRFLISAAPDGVGAPGQIRR